MNDSTATTDRHPMASNRLRKVFVWSRALGPYGEVLTVVALSCAAFCFLFAESAEVRIGLGFFALFAALPFYVVAFTHRQLAKQNEQEQKQLADTAEYRVSAARLEVLRTAKVPRDVLNALKALSGHDPMPKEKLLSMLTYELDLGRERTKEFEDVILKYTKFDRPPQHKRTLTEEQPDLPPSPAVKTQSTGEVREPIAIH